MRFLSLVLEHCENSGSFCTVAGAASKQALDSCKITDTSVSFDYTVPERLCWSRSSKSADASCEFSVSGIMTIFDEFSSYAFMMKDHTRRPGVSLHLGAQIHRPCVHGEVVRVTTCCRKLGKYIGFCDVTMSSVSNPELIYATGQHTKFMPLGPIYELLGNSVVFPAVMSIVDRFRSSEFAKKHFRKGVKQFLNSAPGEYANLQGLKSVFEDMKVISNEDDKNSVTSEKTSSDLLSLPWLASKRVFAFEPTGRYYNPLGKLHGGALAMAIEKAVVLTNPIGVKFDLT